VARPAEIPFAELLNELARRSAAPGAGSAAAWSGALAAALLEMVALYADDEAKADRAHVLRAELLDAAEAELHGYEPVLAAMRLPADEPSRQRQLRDSLSKASETPTAIARACAELAEVAFEVWVHSSVQLRGDVAGGVFLAEAATRSAARLVEINLAGSADDPRLAELRELVDRAAEARAQLLAGPRQSRSAIET
jgi:formiminotetrahydrofolate cyclodeaminase